MHCLPEVSAVPTFGGGNQEVLVAAIHDKLLSLPDETVIYPGHGPETRVIDEKFNNPYL